jgi:hypothetical protein
VFSKPYRSVVLALLLLLLGPAGVHAAATIVIQVSDAAGEGFNDPTAVAPVTGNPGVTLGAQRLNAFLAAAGFWGLFIDSAVTIVVDAAMDPLACQVNGAVLGSAGPNFLYQNFPNAPLPNTWFPDALADALAGADLTAAPDINATFNSDIDNSCFGGGVWWYGIGAPPPMVGQPDYFSTVLHEIGHGLGFADLVNEGTGMMFMDDPDVFITFLEDHGLGLTWPTMTNMQRANSAIDSGDLHWVGANVLASTSILSQGVSGGHVRMYAPNPLEPGSSVAHWDTVLFPHELMEPIATDTYSFVLTNQLFRDIGWTVSGIFFDGFESGDVSLWSSASP